jgi:GNAT superfamily N-acetyltransferase
MIVRPFMPSDIDPIVSLLKRTLTADPMTSGIFQRKALLDPNFDHRAALVADDGGVIGFMLVLTRKLPIEDQAPDFDRSWITLMAVEPSRQRQKVGTKLMGTLEAYLKGKGARSIWVSPYAPNYFSPGVDADAYPGAIEFLSKNGYAEVYRPLSMDASLLGLRTPEWVDQKARQLAAEGVRIEQFTPEHILPLLNFMKAEFPGDWQRYIRETMSKIALGQYSKDQIWTALDGERVLGFAQHEGERFGPFGVAASERGRGIGAVLLFKCLHTMRDKGLHNAWFLWTDDKTARLYAAAGFAETRRYAVMRKVLE